MHFVVEMKSTIEVETSIDVDAPPEAVWRVLTDFRSFHAWNPFLVDASGDLRLGGSVRLVVRGAPWSPVPFVFHAKITVFDPPRQLRWVGDMVAPWLGAGEHAFIIAPRGPGKSSLLHREEFSGLVPRLLRPALVRGARRGFDRMNRALAAQASRESATMMNANGAPL